MLEETGRSGLAGEFFPDAAERLGGDAEVRCDLVLWDLFDQSWIGFDKRQIAFFGRSAEALVDASVGGDVVRFQEQTEVAFHGGDRIEHGIPCLFFQQEDFRVLQRVDRVRRFGSAQEAGQVGDPPVPDRELEYMLLSLMIDRIFPQTTVVDEGQMFAHLPFLQNELPFPDFLMDEEPGAEIEFLPGHRDSFGDMGMEEIEHG